MRANPAGARMRLGRSSPRLLSMKSLALMPTPGRGQSKLHTHALPTSAETAESCGTATPVATTIPVPCAQTPSPHMGARPPRTMITGKAHNPGKNQLPAHKGSSLPCATPKIPTPTTLRVEIGPFRHEIGPIQPDQPDVEARTTSSGAKATCRTSELSASSRSAAVRPISTRTTTDLEPELDRSRRGVRPISTRVTTGLEPELDRSRWP